MEACRVVGQVKRLVVLRTGGGGGGRWWRKIQFHNHHQFGLGSEQMKEMNQKATFRSIIAFSAMVTHPA